MGFEVDVIIIEGLDGVLKATDGVVSDGATTSDLPDSTDKRYVTEDQTAAIDLVPLVAKQNTTVTHTGTINETIVFSQLIPAGTFEVNDFIRFHAHASCTNNANVKTAKFCFNTTNVVAGAVQIGIRQYASIVANPFIRTMVFKNALDAQEIVAASVNVASDEAQTTVADVAARAIDFSVDQYFMITFTLADAADTMKLNYIKAKIER